MSSDFRQCDDCHMNFRTESQLRRHKDKFCIGVDGPIEKNEDLLTSKADRNDMARNRIKQLEDLKKRKSRLQELQDEEERGLLNGLKKVNAASKNLSRRSPDLNQIQDQINKVKNVQKKAMAELANLESRSNAPSRTESELLLIADDNSRPASAVVNNAKLKNEKKLARLKADHINQIQGLQQKHGELETHKEVIHRRLGDLETQGRLREAEKIEQLNRMMLEQDRRNQKAIEDLKSELKDLLRQEKPAPPPPPQQSVVPPSLPPTAPGQTLEAILGEIGALRKQYVNGGGDDPRVLAQMTEMMTEAMSLEKMKQKYRRRRRDRLQEAGDYGPRDRDYELRAIERENNRLQTQLLQMQQFQNFQQPRFDMMMSPYMNQMRDVQSPRTRELERMQRRRELEHQRKLAEVQQEMDLLKQQSMLQKFRREMGLDGDQRAESSASNRDREKDRRPTADHAPALAYTEVPALMQNRSLQGSYAGDPLQPAPYDPNLGFYVFLDFVTGLDPTVTAVRLIAGLYSNVHEVGEPAILPMVRTDTASGNLMTGPETSAVIGAKQPVPKCLPNPNLSLVVEMQSVDGSSLSMKSRAWTKIDLFDDQNRLLSGRWKDHVRKAKESLWITRLKTRCPQGFNKKSSDRPPPTTLVLPYGACATRVAAAVKTWCPRDFCRVAFNRTRNLKELSSRRS